MRGRGSDAGGAGGADRSQSSVLGVVLILAVVIGSLTVIAAAGGVALLDTQEELSVLRAQRVLTQFDSDTALVALGETDSRRVDLGTGQGEYTLDESAGWMNVTVTNQTTGEVKTVMNVTLGSLYYENEEQRVAYQGGGVWRREGGSSRMVSPPELHYRGETLTLPAISLAGASANGGPVTVERLRTAGRFPDRDRGENFTNPVSGGLVEVTIGSKYYQGWGGYFERRTTGGVSYDRDDQEVTLTLLQQGSKRQVTSAIGAVGGGDGVLTIQSGNNAHSVAGYNSSNLSANRALSNPPGNSNRGPIQTDMDLDINGRTAIDGTISTSGKILNLGGSGPPGVYAVEGSLLFGRGTEPSDCETDHVKGVCKKNASPMQPNPADEEVKSTVNRLSVSNDNAKEPCFTQGSGFKFGNASCSSSSNPIEIEAGDYYTTSVIDDGNSYDTVIFDTTGGDITVGVDGGEFKLDDGGNFTVRGNGTVRFYIPGSSSTTVDLSTAESRIWNRGYDADQFWLFLGSESDLDLTAGLYVATLYAPSGPSGDSSVDMTGSGSGTLPSNLKPANNIKVRWFGAIVGGGGGSDVTVKNNAQILFDQGLKNNEVFGGRSLPTVSYLHISNTTVRVED